MGQVAWGRGSQASLLSREASVDLSTFTLESATALPGPPWLQRRRAAAAEAFASSVLPSEKEEIWRYSRIDLLDLDRYRPVGLSGTGVPEGTGSALSARIHALADAFGPRAGLVITLNGVLATVASLTSESQLRLARAGEEDGDEWLVGSVAADPHDFVLLNDAFAVDPLVVDVAPQASIADPVVVVHVVSGRGGEAVFPRTVIRAGSGARASVVEILVDAEAGLLDEGALTPLTAVRRATATPAPDVLVAPVTEVRVSDGASLAYVGIQALGRSTWQLAHQTSAIGAEATLDSFAVALGGSYARLRTNSALEGESGISRLRAAFVGRNDQMLDFRTLQDHLAPRSTSDLLFMGAVADRAHSVYSGLIRVRKGAVRSDAVQTNHNLVLDEGAHADSVPNLDIEENDVRCSHGSTVGPVDEDQLYYLESRGVEPEVAERLIVAGFFDRIADQVPVDGARPLVRRALANRTGAVDG